LYAAQLLAMSIIPKWSGIGGVTSFLLFIFMCIRINARKGELTQ
jgi:hypothetical protein